MAFDDVRLPENLERGSSGGPEFRTTIIELSGGSESRNRDWSYERGRWNVSYGVQSKADYQVLTNFFRARMGRLRGFRFKDWTDYEATEEHIGTGDGSTTTFQLSKAYGTYVRRITRPVLGTVEVTVDGVPTSASVNHSTGVVTISPAPAGDAVVRASFQFDVPVRFESDRMEVSLIWEGAGSVPDLNVVELRE